MSRWLPVHGRNTIRHGDSHVLNLGTPICEKAILLQLSKVKELVQIVVCSGHGEGLSQLCKRKITRVASSICCLENSSSISLDQVRNNGRVDVAWQAEAAVLVMMFVAPS